jgi:tetratricopeptide (TPR) repeat protein
MKSLAIIVVSGSISLGVFSQTPQPETGTAKSITSPSSAKTRPRATGPVQTPSEKAEWERISAIAIPGDRATALRAFIASFPDSEFKARDLLVASEAEEGNLRLQSRELDAAAAKFLIAATEAANPIDDQLFTEVLSKLPANLYFRGARERALRIAGILEEKAATNADQLLVLANFYLSVESGSEARRLAEKAIKIKPESAQAYQTLGLANRMDFLIDDSALAYQKALELDPDSDLARRGLAEMKRSLGKADEAIVLYKEILSRDESNLPARSGLILSMFDAGKQSDAEIELAKSVKENPGNVILLGGVAYWYAAHGQGDKAVEYAKLAIDTDPRFIWSHIALARGYLLLKKPYEAEKSLLAARRYGNFPTLEYEIASARLAAGFFHDAAEEMAKSFSVSDGQIGTKLGGRISRGSKDLTELVGFERRASIFVPTPADTADNSARLTALLALKQALDSPQPNVDSVLIAVEQFLQGDDAMKLHRQLYTAGSLLEKNIALSRAADIAQAAIANVNTGIAVPNANGAVLASELYESRAIAVARGEYLNVPELPRATLSAIVRGRIEEINGWAKYQMGDAQDAVIRLKRAVSVFPADSAWWQSASWRLGTALALGGKETEALETYIRTYRAGGQPDRFRYDNITALYRRVHGNTDDLESLIGPDPTRPIDVAARAKPELEPEAETKAGEQTRIIQEPAIQPSVIPIASSTSEVEPAPGPTPVVPINEEIPTLEPVKETASDDKTAAKSEIFPPVVITIPSPEFKKARDRKPIPYLPNPEPQKTQKIVDKSGEAARSDVELMPGRSQPAIDPPEEVTKFNESTARNVPESRTDGVAPCTINSSEENITLLSESGGRAVIVGIDDETDLEGIKGYSSSPENINVRREPIAGIKSRALFVIRSENSKAGVYQVTFELPCGKKVVVVKVR